MKILLFGKTGQLGQELQRALLPVGDVTPLGRGDVDLRDRDALLDALSIHRPDVIVNAAAYTAVDQAETDRQTATQVNAEAVSAMARYARDSRALLVHYSTDYVFDGALHRPYTETDVPNPRNLYGVTKLAGESAVLASACEALVFRCGWMYAPQGRNFPNTILRLAQTRSSLDVVSDQHGSPTSAGLVADVTALAISRRRQQSLAPGIYHLAAGGYTNWHAFARYLVAGAIARGASLALSPDRIRAIASKDYAAAAKRPHNSMLDTTRLGHALGREFSPWTEDVDGFLDQLFERGDDACCA
ncbi:dTDP-4-dehydrorhamnose reductase [compost metagenome]|uniref:dTDP-4-dehydrorhamnose reductase n=1 Tax=Achromobacter sp. Root83 TaxID=1736602 RepID=UPI00070C059C|nr:dTDP-4-dehydrorhamnose reductase [Achromobacter sp. Root83]KRC73441.1 dTDP-4-dehydrorhamnose reductase [Achromobacter sp. Root83]